MKTVILGVVGGATIGFIIAACGIHFLEQPLLFLALAVPWCTLWAIFATKISE